MDEYRTKWKELENRIVKVEWNYKLTEIEADL
jgi:hypothetical protein